MEKRENYKSEWVSKEFAKDHEEENRKAGRSKSATQKNNKSKRMEFIGWGSRSLIEFLASMVKDTSVTLSQHDVASIVDNYIKEKKLFDPKNKKRLTCDASLQSLFGKKIINKNLIYNLLELHFTEHQHESEEDGNDSEDNEGKTLVAYKRQRKQDAVKYSQKEGKEYGAHRIYFASIITDNIKLIYLKKSLLFELFGQPESFEEKVIGSFVRVKIDPYDYRQKISYRLVQVKGIKKDSIVENNTEIILHVSSLLKGDIPMSKMLDYDFS
ncbi:zinc finger CCCH domain-containing 44 isoform X1 [Olea europaea subsp. europaea]|uniref:Zinc finger CCCH domain-containing 44 isoform X1 n=1 Tax=Olea europaea subsp. europaea TaxID=158383 RepID=A0A8S0TQC5_OLEEU|nr:zinc finger CCCH domain-containing 44 isoform X1 [Olea europaea subsp. europaea]